MFYQLWESRPFREEPETFISILISPTPMHLELFVMHSALPARPQPLVKNLQLVEVRPYLEERKKARYMLVTGVSCQQLSGLGLRFGVLLLPESNFHPLFSHVPL